MPVDNVRFRLLQMQTQLRRRLLLRGGLWFLAAVSSTCLVWGWLDSIFQPTAPGGRWLTSLSLLSLGLLFAYQFLLKPWRASVTLTDIALQLERARPEFNGLLAAHIALTSAVRVDASNSADDALFEFEPAEVSPGWRPLMWATIPLLLSLSAVVPVVVRSPHLAQVAAARLCLPGEAIRWPRSTELQLLTGRGRLLSPRAPLRVDARQTLTLYVRDIAGEPPKSVVWELKHQNGKIEQQRIEQSAGVERRYDFRFTWLPSSDLSWVRVHGGDDRSMPWCPIETVTAPLITAMQVDLEFPAYLQLPQRRLDALPVKLSLPMGTRLTLRGTLDRRVDAVQLMSPGNKPQPLSLGSEGTSFEWAETIRDSQRKILWFEAIDGKGVTSTRPPRHELIPLADTVPETRIEIPAQDIFVTPTAQVPLQFSIRDDHGLRRVELRGEHNGISNLLWHRDWLPGETQSGNINVMMHLTPESGPRSDNSVTIHGPSTPLSIGDELRLTLIGQDFLLADDRVGTSPQRVLRVVTPAEKTQELEQRVLAQVQLLRTHVDIFEQRHASMMPLLTSTNAELTEQAADYRSTLALGAKLLRHELGVVSMLRQIVDEAAANELAAERLQEPLAAAIGQLAQVEAVELTNVETAMLRLLQDPTESAGRIRLQLTSESLVQSYREVLTVLQRWDRQRDYLENFDELFAQFEELQTETTAVAQRTIALSADRLTPTDRAALLDLSERHQTLAAGYRQLQQQEVSEATSQPLLADCQQQLIQLDPSAQLQQIGTLLNGNRMGQGVQQQRVLREDLRRIDAALHGGSPPGPTELLNQVAENEAALRSLLEHAQQLQQDLEQAFQDDRAAREAAWPQFIGTHEELILEGERIGRNLRHLELNSPGRALHRATEALRESRLAMNPLDRADSDLHLTEAMTQALSALAELERLTSQLQQEHTANQLASVAQRIAEIVAGQQRVMAETQQLLTVFTAQGRWNRTELKLLLEQATVQQQLADALAALTTPLAQLETLQFVAGGIGREMRTVQQELHERRINDNVISRQQRIVDQLGQLATVLEPDSGEPVSDPAQGNETDAMNPSSIPLNQAAELKLVVSLQLDLAQRTEQLLNTSDISPDERSRQQQELSDEQARIALWLRRLLPHQ